LLGDDIRTHRRALEGLEGGGGGAEEGRRRGSHPAEEESGEVSLEKFFVKVTLYFTKLLD
jgi:hypothetical protein